MTMFLFHNGIDPVQIFQAGNVTHDRRNIFTDGGCGLFQLLLPSASDYDVCAFFQRSAWLLPNQSRCFHL